MAWATTTAKVVKVLTQQAILHTNTDFQGTCTIAVSTSPTFAPVINDLDTNKFAGSNLDSRNQAVSNGRDRWFVIGKRAAEKNIAGTWRYSRSLQEETLYYWQETCGSDVVSSSFTTHTILFGNSYADPRYDRSIPGDTAFETLDYTTTTLAYVDPYTGAKVIRMDSIHDIDEQATVEQFSVFKTTLNGTGYTIVAGSATYNGTNQNYVVLASSVTSILNPTNDDRDPIYIQLNATLYGTASSVDVCLTVDGQKCTGATINQAITTTPTPYVIGSTVPILSSWRNTPAALIKNRDIHQISISATIADGKNVVISGPPFFNVAWSSGSVVTIGTNTVTISSITDQNDLTVSTQAPNGTFTLKGQNFGFMIKDHAATNDTFTVRNATYTLDVAGWPEGFAGSEWQMCSSSVTVGPTGLGSLCMALAHGRGYMDDAMYWIGEDGTAIMIGLCTPNTTGTGLSANAFCFGQLSFDVNQANKWYTLSARASDNAPVMYSMTYTGTYANVPGTYFTPMANSSATIVSGDLGVMTHAFDSTFSSTTFTSWSIYTSVAFGAKGAVVLWVLQAGQNSPGWIVIYDLNTNAIIAAMSSVLGASTAPNRWLGLHGFGVSTAGSWIIMNGEDGLSYFVGITSNTFNANPVACPVNPVDIPAIGQAKCTLPVTLSTDTPNNAGASLFNIKLSTGDTFFLRDNGTNEERVRILTVNGLTAVFERCQQSFFFPSCGDHTNTGDTIDLQVTGGPNTNDVDWNYIDDPHAVGLTESYGQSVMWDPVSYDCHQNLGFNFNILACLEPPVFTPPISNSDPIRPGPLPNFTNGLVYENQLPGFSGDLGTTGENIVGYHPSDAGHSPWWFDTHPVVGLTGICEFGNCTKISGTQFIWKAPAIATAGFDYRRRPYMMASGEKEFSDVSPTVITDTIADNYKFCYAVTSGDCFAGSASGDVYMNVPFVTQSFGNFFFLPADPYIRDLSLGTMEGTFNYAIQFLYAGSDIEGHRYRALSTDFQLPRVQVNYNNGRPTPTGTWHYQNIFHANLAHSDYFISKIPSIGAIDGKNRSTYLQVPIQVTGTSGDQFRLRFGYGEYGTASQFFCSPRQMQCSTDATLTKPYLWSDETQQWKSCSSSCTLNLPVIPGHVAYYVVDRKNSAGGILTGPIQLETGE